VCERVLAAWLALIALILAGCGGPEAERREAVRRPAPADEAAQAERNALETIKASCAGREGDESAAAAISLLIDHARRDIESGSYEDNLAWRRHLAWLANQLERHRCLTPQVPRIDRALRRLPLPELPEPEERYEPEYEYEPPYP
jgi:hypothetical protein